MKLSYGFFSVANFDVGIKSSHTDLFFAHINMLSDSQIHEYLDFLGCATLITPSLSSLAAIHKAHICRIPFNNLCTVQDNRNVCSMGFVPSAPSLDIDVIFIKMVHQRK